MKFLAFLLLGVLPTVQATRAATISVSDFTLAGGFNESVILQASGALIPDGTGLVRVGYFRDFQFIEPLLRSVLNMEPEIAHSVVSDFFVPFGEGLPGFGSPPIPPNGPQFRPRVVNGVPEFGRLFGSIQNVIPTSNPPNTFDGIGVPVGSRLFLLIYNASAPELTTEMGIYSADNWLMPFIVGGNFVLNTTSVDLASEVFRGSIGSGSLVLSPGLIPEPGVAMLLTAAFGLLRPRRRRTRSHASLRMENRWREARLSSHTLSVMKLLLTSAAAIGLTFSASAQEWARFLGANGSATGTAPGVPATFTDADYAWKTELPGTGCSSPVAWGDHIFLTAELPEGGQRAVLCYSLTTGKEVWRYADKFQPHGKHNFNSFASSTPVVDKDRVYLAWTSGGAMRTLALTHAGKKAWEKELGPYSEQHGSGASPVMAGGSLIILSDCEKASGGITALKPSDGSVIWKCPRNSERTPFSTPLTFEEKPGQWRVVVSSNPKGLTCLDAKNGKILWELDNPSPNLRAVGSPAMSDGVIFAAIGQGGTAKGSIAAKVANGKAEKVWEGKKAMPYVPTPLALGDHFLFLGDGGILSSVRASDGEMLWSERLFQDQAYSSPVCTGDKIFCISRNGTVAAVQASAKEFKLLGTTPLGDPCDSTPAIAGGKLIIRTAHKLLCIPGAKAVP